MSAPAAQAVPAPLKSVTPQHASAALRWFETMRRNEEWGLTTEEQIQLLGGIKKRTFQEWKKN